MSIFGKVVGWMAQGNSPASPIELGEPRKRKREEDVEVIDVDDEPMDTARELAMGTPEPKRMRETVPADNTEQNDDYVDDVDMGEMFLRSHSVRSGSPPRVEVTQVLDAENVLTIGAACANYVKCFDVLGRTVLLVYIAAENKFYCMDGFCYHMGHALEDADIEDIGGSPTVQCSLHLKRFRVGAGDEVDKSGALVLRHAQRVHEVVEMAGGGIGVTLVEGGQYHSDGNNSPAVQQCSTPSLLPRAMTAPANDTPLSQVSQVSTPPSTPGRSQAFYDSPMGMARRGQRMRMQARVILTPQK